uniref:G-protein coupled receptors family 2 profile 2 domain-containing protein n=1 Tax=Astyanax mexicanus TaxID=7994 RepID=A0A8B9JS25_ASTMX
MDTTLFQLFLGEFGEPNCSLMDAFQDTFYQNSSLTLMSLDGEGVFYPRSAYRECLENGTWAFKINYSSCEPILEEKRKYPMHYKIALIINYLGHCISVGALVVAFILFLCLRSIRCLRNVIHWNLITTFILRNVMWFLLQLIDHNIHERNELHRAKTIYIYIYIYIYNDNIMGVKKDKYLISNPFMSFVLILGIPCPIIVAWAIGKLYNENEQCWFGKEPGKYIDYIYQGPVIVVLLVTNLIISTFLSLSLPVSLCLSLSLCRKAVKATLVLLPLLGITYMLFFVNPGEDDISQIVFIYFNSFLQSFQIRSAARKRWHRWQDNHTLRVRVARAMSIPTSPTRISFHSIKHTTAV